MKLKRKHAILSASAILLLAILALLPAWIERLRQPVYEGRRVGEWFHEFCAPVLDSSGQPDPNTLARKKTALDVFSRMDSNAVPFLVKKLTQRAPFREKLICKGREMAIFNPLFQRIHAPSYLRLAAASALRQMGTNAEASAPFLLLEYRKSKHPTYLIALSVVLGAPFHPANVVPGTQFQNVGLAVHDLEEGVMQVAKARHPHLFPLVTNAFASDTVTDTFSTTPTPARSK
jgi:hypothetical protein